MDNDMRPSGTLGMKVMRSREVHKAGIGYKLRNLPSLIRSAPALLLEKASPVPIVLGKLTAVKYGPEGDGIDYGLLGARVVTTQFVNYMVANMIAETGSWGDFKYHDSGIGTGAEAITDTTLGSPADNQTGNVRFAGTQVTGGQNYIYQSVATITYVSGGAITEHGLFNETRANSAAQTLLDRTMFAAINVTGGDSIAFTYQLTCTGGG